MQVLVVAVRVPVRRGVGVGLHPGPVECLSARAAHGLAGGMEGPGRAGIGRDGRFPSRQSSVADMDE